MEEDVRTVIARHGPELMRLPGVVAVAESRQGGEACVLVLARTPSEALRTRLEQLLPGQLIRLESSDEFQAGSSEP